MAYVIFFALCCCVAAPETRVQTNELQSLSENAMHSFTPLPPLNISGYTAVFPPMFQLYIYMYVYIYLFNYRFHIRNRVFDTFGIIFAYMRGGLNPPCGKLF